MKTQRFNVALPRELVEKVDDAARREYKNRSELIREALRIYIADTEELSGIFAEGEKAARKTGIKSESQVVRLVENYRKSR